jgi:hypothetical protein
LRACFQQISSATFSSMEALGVPAGLW